MKQFINLTQAPERLTSKASNYYFILAKMGRGRKTSAFLGLLTLDVSAKQQQQYAIPRAYEFLPKDTLVTSYLVEGGKGAFNFLFFGSTTEQEAKVHAVMAALNDTSTSRFADTEIIIKVNEQQFYELDDLLGKKLSQQNELSWSAVTQLLTYCFSLMALKIPGPASHEYLTDYIDTISDSLKETLQIIEGKNQQSEQAVAKALNVERALTSNSTSKEAQADSYNNDNSFSAKLLEEFKKIAQITDTREYKTIKALLEPAASFIRESRLANLPEGLKQQPPLNGVKLPKNPQNLQELESFIQALDQTTLVAVGQMSALELFKTNYSANQAFIINTLQRLNTLTMYLEVFTEAILFLENVKKATDEELIAIELVLMYPAACFQTYNVTNKENNTLTIAKFVRAICEGDKAAAKEMAITVGLQVLQFYAYNGNAEVPVGAFIFSKKFNAAKSWLQVVKKLTEVLPAASLATRLIKLASRAYDKFESINTYVEVLTKLFDKFFPKTAINNVLNIKPKEQAKREDLSSNAAGTNANAFKNW